MYNLASRLGRLRTIRSPSTLREAWPLPSGCGVFSLEQAFLGKTQEACRGRESCRTLSQAIALSAEDFAHGSHTGSALIS